MPDFQEIVLRCTDLNSDDRANDMSVKEDFVQGLVDDDVIHQDPISDVQEPPSILASALPGLEHSFAEGLDGAHQSLGSMGAHDDSDESYDEEQVILFWSCMSHLFVDVFGNELVVLNEYYT